MRTWSLGAVHATNWMLTVKSIRQKLNIGQRSLAVAAINRFTPDMLDARFKAFLALPEIQMFPWNGMHLRMIAFDTVDWDWDFTMDPNGTSWQQTPWNCCVDVWMCGCGCEVCVCVCVVSNKKSKCALYAGAHYALYSCLSLLLLFTMTLSFSLSIIRFSRKPIY